MHFLIFNHQNTDEQRNITASAAKLTFCTCILTIRGHVIFSPAPGCISLAVTYGAIYYSLPPTLVLATRLRIFYKLLAAGLCVEKKDNLPNDFPVWDG